MKKFKALIIPDFLLTGEQINYYCLQTNYSWLDINCIDINCS